MLHPGAPARNSDPIPVPDLRLPPGYRLVDRDTLGEYALGVLIADGTGKENLGWIAAEGWDGDALFRFERSEGADGITVWRVRFRSETDAEDFRYGMSRVFSGGEVPSPGERPAEEVFPAEGRVARLLRRGTEVDVRVAPLALDAMLGTLVPSPPVVEKNE